MTLQVAELFFSQSCLLQDLAERAGGERGGVHRDVGLPAIGMPEDLMTASLSDFHEPRAQEACEHFTR